MSAAGSPADERVERALLALLLACAEPGGQPLRELVDEIGDHAATQRALTRLQAVGLAEVLGEDRVAPTPAALRFDELII